MIVYEKKAEGARHLFGNFEASVPSSADNQLIYTDNEGTVLTPVEGDTYVDGGSSRGTQRIIRLSDNKPVNVFIDEHLIIGDAVTPPPVTYTLVVTQEPTKKEYMVGESFDPAGLALELQGSDGSAQPVEVSACTFSPEQFTLAGRAVEVTITHTASGKSAQIIVAVIAADGSLYYGATHEIPTSISGLTKMDAKTPEELLAGITLNIEAGHLETDEGQYPVIACPKSYNLTDWQNAATNFSYTETIKLVDTDNYNIYYMPVKQFRYDNEGNPVQELYFFKFSQVN